MSKRLVITVVVVSVIAGCTIGYVRGLPDDFVDSDAAVQEQGDYGYRCGDGSEFTVVPSRDMQTIRVIPATSVDYLKDSVLTSEEDAAGVSYRSGGVTMRPKGASIVLTTIGHGTTMCSPMQSANTLFE